MQKDSFKIGVIVTVVVGLLFLFGLPGLAIYRFVKLKNNSVTANNPATFDVSSFSECVSAGNPVMESYPRQCKNDGINYVENIGNGLEKANLIRVVEPRQGDVISSPFVIRGEARGNWFFEASFPIKLFDANGKELLSSYIMASGDWMTEEFVPFEKSFEFKDPASGMGKLILYKDNPSGLPENDDSVEISVRFGKKDLSGACVVTGCSGQVCSDKEVNTTCEYKESYACFKDAVCEKQASGRCGWTGTDSLKQCLEKFGVDVNLPESQY